MRGMWSVFWMPWLQQEDMFDGDKIWGQKWKTEYDKGS